MYIKKVTEGYYICEKDCIMTWYDLYILLNENIDHNVFCSATIMRYFDTLAEFGFSGWSHKIILESEELANNLIEQYDSIFVMEKLCISKK